MDINENDLFIEMYDAGNFDWWEFEEGTYQFLREQSVHKDQKVCDGYIEVKNVVEVSGRFFEVEYTLKGKDLDEEYYMENPCEVYPHEVTTIVYKYTK